MIRNGVGLMEVVNKALVQKKKRVGEEQSFRSSASMPSVNGEDEPMARPMGVKAAKAKAKRPVGEEGKNLQELRQM